MDCRAVLCGVFGGALAAQHFSLELPEAVKEWSLAGLLYRLPPVDEQILQMAVAVAEASHWESNPASRKLLEEQALRLWAAAHQARRDAMYQRGRRQ